MNYCGIDVAMKSSYLYITDGKGRKKASGEIPTTYMALRRRLRPFVRGGLKIAIEAGNQTAWIYECLDGLPRPVHMPGRPARELRGLLVARRQLVSARTKICNVVRGLLRQEGIHLPARYLITFKGWQTLMENEGYACEHIAPILSAYYGSFVSLTRSIQALDKELVGREKQDARAARLRTIPKVGRIASLTFLAAVDDVRRFGSSRKLVSYSGLCPTVRSSGERTEYGSISRAGRSELRAVWVQIAHLVVRDTHRNTARLRAWYAKVARKRGTKTAIVAMARKLLTIAYRLLTIAYRLLTDQTEYRSSLVSRRAA